LPSLPAYQLKFFSRKEKDKLQGHRLSPHPFALKRKSEGIIPINQYSNDNRVKIKKRKRLQIEIPDFQYVSVKLPEDSKNTGTISADVSFSATSTAFLIFSNSSSLNIFFIVNSL
jgi:hypothetical protein